MKLVFALLLFSAATLLSSPAFAGDDKTKGKDTLVVIGTSFGEITLILYPETPRHRSNFFRLAGEKFYDSTSFHRIIKNFMIQGGDPNSKDDQPGNDGQGGPGYTIPAEFNPEFTHVQGALAAARQGDQFNPEKASSGSQFYIVENPGGTPFLNMNYTVFGQTIKGLEVVSAIASQPKDGADRPDRKISMWVKLLPMKKEKVTQTYGYDYATRTIRQELIKK